MMKSRAYENKQIAVLGLGKSGLATARRLVEGHARVVVWDDTQSSRDAANSLGLVVQNYDGTAWQGAKTIVLSPGIPLTHPKPHPIVEFAHANDTAIIGDIEIFLTEKTAGKIVGITGTNGKSTTTALIHHVLASAGCETALGGNIGTPVMDLPQLEAAGIYVLELSSYQLDLTPSWHADVAILLNITPDHLDRHGDLAGYAAVKKRIFQNQINGDTAIINMDDRLCREIAATVINDNQLVAISTEIRLADGVSVLKGLLQVRSADEILWQLDLENHVALKGAHNWQNVAAAVACAVALGLSQDQITSGVLSFGGLAHRMEPVTQIGKVRFVNDSKATNAEAAAKSLGSFENIYWICGGVAKAGGITSLTPYFDRIAHVFLIGECSDEFAATLDGALSFDKCETLEAAVNAAAALSSKSGVAATVLLAPAAASFDQFKSFEVRGDAFKALVMKEASS